jgi:hypothetical protein
LSILTQWLANDLIKEMIKQLSCYTSQLKTLGISSKFAPLLYLLVGAKALDLAMATGKSLKEGVDGSITNAKTITLYCKKTFNSAIFAGALVVDKLPIKLVVVTPESFAEIKKDKVKLVGDNAEVIIKQHIPLEFVVSTTSVAAIKNVCSSPTGTFNATATVNLKEFKDGKIKIKVKPQSDCPPLEFNLNFK